MKTFSPRLTTAIVLDSKRVKKDGTSLIKLRLTFQRKSKYYSLKNESGKKLILAGTSFANNEPFAFSKAVFKQVMAKNPQDQYLLARQILDKIRSRAMDMAKDLEEFSFQAFEERFRGKESNVDEKDLFTWIKRLAIRMREEGRISTAVSFECALESLSNFTGKETLMLNELTPSFLMKYEEWMERGNRSKTTTGIYLRAVRVAYNRAMKKGMISSDKYPFGKPEEEKYTIPTGQNVKKALTLNQVGLLANYDAPKDSATRKYRDFWLFTYLGNGMNVKDMANLRYKNLDGDKLTFIREKTKRETKSNPEPIKVIITSLAKRIIREWGNQPAEPDTYIFPILEPGASPERQYKLIRQATKMINKYIANVAAEVGITQKVTTYVSRHSFATVLKRSGVSPTFIKDALGHKDLKTTENYLAGFDDEELRKNANILTQFGKKKR